MVLALEGGREVPGPVVLRKHVSQAGVQLDQGVPLRDPVQVVKGLGVLRRMKERLRNDAIHAISWLRLLLCDVRRICAGSKF